MIKKLKRIVDNIGMCLSVIGTISLLFIMMYTVISVFLRFFTGKPLLGTVELGSILLPVIAALFYVYTDVLERHIRATIIYERFSANTQRILDIIYNLVACCIFGIVGWRVFIYGYKCMQMGSETSVLALPTHPFHFTFSIVFCFFSLYMLIKSIYLFSLMTVHK